MKKIINESPQLRRSILKVVLLLYVLLLVAIFYGVTFSILSSLQYARSYSSDTAENESVKVAESPEVMDLKARRTFLEARSRLVNYDSVSLTVNLGDSTITLEQKGVVLHTAHISSLKLSRVFRRIHQDDLLTVTSAPFTIQESVSTIAKKRFNLKVAPSDTSVYAPMVLPDTSSQETVCFRLGLDRGIQLDIRQSDNPDEKQVKQYRQGINRQESSRILSDLLAFRVPQYHPVIQLEITEQDARAIYKALPVNAKVALRI